jgi:chromosome partitioning protein
MAAFPLSAATHATGATRAGLVLIPAACDSLSLHGINDTLETLSLLPGAPTLILPTFYDERTRETARILAQLRDWSRCPDPLLSPIHRATVIREALARGQTTFEYAPASRAAEEYARVVWAVRDAHD